MAANAVAHAEQTLHRPALHPVAPDPEFIWRKPSSTARQITELTLTEADDAKSFAEFHQNTQDLLGCANSDTTCKLGKLPGFNLAEQCR